jgi:hypothetical protein
LCGVWGWGGLWAWVKCCWWQDHENSQRLINKFTSETLATAGKPAQGFGLMYKGRLVCFYTYECDLGNGWEDQDIYNDPENIRQQALKMGANILQYVFAN